MENNIERLVSYLSRWSLLLLLLLLFGCTGSSAAASNGYDANRLALLSFRDEITGDPERLLSSWNDSINFCQWKGVTCDINPPLRVISLDITDGGLTGRLSPSIGNLTFLRLLTLPGNRLAGEIPPEISRMAELEVLDLGGNSFEGEIPASLSNCSYLSVLNLMDNHLVGSIPASVAALSNLLLLYLHRNRLTGVIPPGICNLTLLTNLGLMSNNLEGNILGGDAGCLESLQFLQVSGNNLTGTIPAYLYNISSLSYLAAADNQLFGSLPADMGSALPNLQELIIGGNNIQGSIPSTLSNASNLQVISFSANLLTGEIPRSLGRLGELTKLDLQINLISNRGNWEFLDALGNCTRLRSLLVNQNALTGELPGSMAGLLPQLEEMIMSYNNITGKIPSGTGNLTNLYVLDLGSNLITSDIPASITKLTTLQLLIISSNYLTGTLPWDMGNMTQLSEIYLNDNHLEGQIPPSLGDLQHIVNLLLFNNRFDQTIPPEIFLLPAAIQVDLHGNSLSGHLPPEVGRMQNLEVFRVSQNNLSGEIPETLGNCLVLQLLELSHNSFQGRIPSTMNSLKGMVTLDLSCNNLSGTIDGLLEDMPFLSYLNLSYNHLEGEVPIEGAYGNAAAIVSLAGNSGLCGGVPELNLPPCSASAASSTKVGMPLPMKILIAGSVAALSVVLLTLLAAIILYVKHRQKGLITALESNSSLQSYEEYYPEVSYEELLRATKGFSPANLIGRGAHGCVYKGEMGPEKTTVAVKVFNLRARGALKSFRSEIRALRNFRHRNLVKILASCSAIDPQGRNFKAIVYEFMPNGSLEAWLHPIEEDGGGDVKHLSLIRRLNIAVDIAEALLYLHNGGQSSIAHCDLKPSNVLLDSNMTARLTDFGLAKFVTRSIKESSENSISSIGLRGSIGYVAPEFGTGGLASTHSDVYSYGIVVLEIFTGRRPVDEMFKDDTNLHGFVERALPDRAMEIVDPRLLTTEDGGIIAGCAATVLKLGLLCSNQHPGGRMTIKDAEELICTIRNSCLIRNASCD